jgi:hypothetical protein
MQPFTPDIHITAIDDHDVVVTFDSGASHDYARGAKALRIRRNFTELSVRVEGILDLETRELGTTKEYRGSLRLVVSGADGKQADYLLSELVLRGDADRRRRTGDRFPPAEQVAQDVRQGLAAAFARALATYYAKEAQLDTVGRAPHRLLTESPPAAPASIAAASPPINAGFFPALAPPTQYSGPPHRRSRGRVIAAAVATPLVVITCLWIAGVKKRDPIAEAVAQSMVQNPRSVQSQVDLTKETLRQMGLDPGKSNDLGCLAAQ